MHLGGLPRVQVAQAQKARYPWSPWVCGGGLSRPLQLSGDFIYLKRDKRPL